MVHLDSSSPQDVTFGRVCVFVYVSLFASDFFSQSLRILSQQDSGQSRDKIVRVTGVI